MDLDTDSISNLDSLTALDTIQEIVTTDCVQVRCYNELAIYIDTLSGMIRGMNKLKIGKFTPNGDIRDSNGDLLGSINGNKFLDANNDLLGSINPSGEVFDINEMKIGEIKSNNQIIDANGMEIAMLQKGLDKRWLAAYFFFFFTTI